MRYSIVIDQYHSIEWELVWSEASVFSYLIQLPTWAERIELGGMDYYFANRHKIVEELPLVTDKPDTAYRILKKLQKKGLIDYQKYTGKDYVRMLPKGKVWNSQKRPKKITKNSDSNPKKLGFKSEKGEKLGFKSEKTRIQIRKNSDSNPTDKYYNIISTTKDNKQQQEVAVADYLQKLILDENFLCLTAKNLGLDSGLVVIKKLAKDFYDFKNSLGELNHKNYSEFRKNFRFWLNKQDLKKWRMESKTTGVTNYRKFNQGKSGIVKVGDLGANQELPQLLDFETGKKLLWYFLTRNGQQEFSVTDSNKTILRLLTEYFSQTKTGEMHRQHGFCLFGAKGVGKSDLMTAFKLFTKEMKRREFKIARCEKIVENLGIEKSVTSLAKYYSGDWCFEGVGEESTSFNLFGNTVEVMKKIFTERMRSNARTYLTTRLTPPQFREVYGEEVFEWLAGNMNFLIFQKHEDEKQAAA